MPERQSLQSLWKNQNQDEFSMSLAHIRARAERFQSRIRWRNWLEYAAGAIVIAAFSFFAVTTSDLIVRAGAVLIVLGAIYVAWKFATMARAASSDAAAQAASWAEFHRAELVRQRDALRTVWRWYLGPFAPGLVVFLAGFAFSPGVEAPLAAKAAAFAVELAIVGAVFVAIGAINARAAKTLDAEIAALDDARR